MTGGETEYLKYLCTFVTRLVGIRLESPCATVLIVAFLAECHG